MGEFPPSTRLVRFGVFEVDLHSGELRKRGVRLKLQGQPYLFLVTLLKRHGELVTREEIRSTLWPDGTFTDFDHGVGTALNKLRDVLNDSATNPRFVETLPGEAIGSLLRSSFSPPSDLPRLPLPEPSYKNSLQRTNPRRLTRSTPRHPRRMQGRVSRRSTEACAGGRHG